MFPNHSNGGFQFFHTAENDITFNRHLVPAPTVSFKDDIISSLPVISYFQTLNAPLTWSTDYYLGESNTSFENNNAPIFSFTLQRPVENQHHIYPTINPSLEEEQLSSEPLTLIAMQALLREEMKCKVLNRAKEGMVLLQDAIKNFYQILSSNKPTNTGPCFKYFLTVLRHKIGFSNISIRGKGIEPSWFPNSLTRAEFFVAMIKPFFPLFEQLTIEELTWLFSQTGSKRHKRSECIQELKSVFFEKLKACSILQCQTIYEDLLSNLTVDRIHIYRFIDDLKKFMQQKNPQYDVLNNNNCVIKKDKNKLIINKVEKKKNLGKRKIAQTRFFLQPQEHPLFPKMISHDSEKNGNMLTTFKIDYAGRK